MIVSLWYIQCIVSKLSTVVCSSFIRLCDYLVVTMLHDLAVKSTSHILDILKIQTARDAEIADLVRELPDDIEEQEKMLQVH